MTSNSESSWGTSIAGGSDMERYLKTHDSLINSLSFLNDINANKAVFFLPQALLNEDAFKKVNKETREKN